MLEEWVRKKTGVGFGDQLFVVWTRYDQFRDRYRDSKMNDSRFESLTTTQLERGRNIFVLLKKINIFIKHNIDFRKIMECFVRHHRGFSVLILFVIIVCSYIIIVRSCISSFFVISRKLIVL